MLIKKLTIRLPKEKKYSIVGYIEQIQKTLKNLRLKMEPRHCKKGCKKTKKAETSSVKACFPIIRKKVKT